MLVVTVLLLVVVVVLRGAICCRCLPRSSISRSCSRGCNGLVDNIVLMPVSVPVVVRTWHRVVMFAKRAQSLQPVAAANANARHYSAAGADAGCGAAAKGGRRC